MLEKTMKKVLTKKINAWLDTITDDSVVQAIKKDLIITGGCFVSMIQNETPKDYDCYFRTKETVLKVAQYYADLWNDAHPNQENKIGYKTKVMVLDGENPSSEIRNYYAGKEKGESNAVLYDNCPHERVKLVFPSDGIVGDLESIRADEELGLTAEETIEELDETRADEIIEQEKKLYFPVFISSNAITLSDGIQLIVRFYGEPSQVHDTFDFVHTKAYYDIKDKQIVIPSEVYEAVVNKTLVYTGSKYPVASIFRLRKFISRGWTINAGQILKMVMQTNQLDLMDINVLEEQLTGVDSIYFTNLIKQFREQKHKDTNFQLTSGYVYSIVDKIF